MCVLLPGKGQEVIAGFKEILVLLQEVTSEGKQISPQEMKQIKHLD